MSASCDLVRKGVNRAILMEGSLKRVAPNSWDATQAWKTPVVILGDNTYSIIWKQKRIQALTAEELSGLLSSTHLVTHRLREVQALELQQSLLADIGRVGLMAPMPGTFHVQFDCYFMGTGDTLQKLEVSKGETEGATCFIGKELNRIVMTEGAADQLLTAIAGIQEGQVSQRQQHLRAFRSLDAEKLIVDLERGITVPNLKSTWHPSIETDTGTIPGGRVVLLKCGWNPRIDRSMEALLGIAIREPLEPIATLIPPTVPLESEQFALLDNHQNPTPLKLGHQ